MTEAHPTGTDRARVAVGRHLEAWTIEDLDERHKKMKETYTEDIRHRRRSSSSKASSRTTTLIVFTPDMHAVVDGVR
jgi:hypothetical protein